MAGWGGSLTSGGGGGGGGAGPLVTNFQPTAGTPIAQNQPIEFDILRATSLAALVIVVDYFETGAREVAFDKEGFSLNYAQDSTMTVITDGKHVHLKRRGGWFRSPRIIVTAADTNGNSSVDGGA